MSVEQAFIERAFQWHKRLVIGLSAAAAALLLPATPSFANVFEIDDRRLITPDDQMGFVGVIACADTKRIPTASLITTPDANPARRHEVITTVAHAFYTKDGDRWQDCSFLPEGDATRALPITYVMTGTSTPGKGWNDDWAVAIVQGRVPIDMPMPLSVDLAAIEDHRAAGGLIQLAGHNGERLPMLMSENCGPRHKRSGSHNFGDARVFNHDCDMISGWSGGPLLLRTPTDVFTIAVNSTRFNPVVHQTGFPFDDRFNPNTAIRVDNDFLAVIKRLTVEGAPIQLANTSSICNAGDQVDC
jgi:protease YdgD